MTTQTKPTFIRGTEFGKKHGVSKGMLNNWRYSGKLIEGAHYIKPTPTDVLYNEELLVHFIHWTHDPITHMAVVARCLESLPYRQFCLDGSAEPLIDSVPGVIQ